MLQDPNCALKLHYTNLNPNTKKQTTMLDQNLDPNFRKGDAKTDVFGSDAMLQPAPVQKIPAGPTTRKSLTRW